MREIWISTFSTNKKDPKTIIAISNKGRIIRKNGTVENTFYMQQFNYNGKKVLIHRFIADNFIHKTEDDIMKQRNCIDHITHHPENMNINDIRNMRWCTHKENCNFQERIEQLSKSKKGQPSPRKGCIVSKETRIKQSNARKGKEPWNKGKSGYHIEGYVMTEEEKLKHSKAMLGKFKGKHWHIENGKRVWED